LTEQSLTLDRYGLRRVLKDAFRKSATRFGAEIFEGVNISSFDQNAPSITLDDGKVIECDLIIAADGSGSQIRQTLFPQHPGRVILNKTVWQISLPLDVVCNDDILRGLLDEHHNVITVAPGRSIFASPSPSQNTYDVQLIDHEYTLDQDPNPKALNERIFDLERLKQRFSDFDASTRKAIECVESAFKWRLVEVFDLPAWSNEDGSVIIIGDAGKCTQKVPIAIDFDLTSLSPCHDTLLRPRNSNGPRRRRRALRAPRQRLLKTRPAISSCLL
jgi:salicylate hydroxylase